MTLHHALVLRCTQAKHRLCAKVCRVAQHWGDSKWGPRALREVMVVGFDKLDYSFTIEAVMTSAKIIEEIGARVSDAIASSPARDVDKNVRALLNSAIGRLDLVTRADFDLQTQVLLRTREKLEAMTVRVGELEAQLAKRGPKT